jgi:hypothetical protein
MNLNAGGDAQTDAGIPFCAVPDRSHSVPGTRAHRPCCRLGEHLQARCQERELVEHSKSHEHPELIRVRNTVLRAARPEMLRHLGPNDIKLVSARRGETANACLVEGRLCGSPSDVWTARSAGRIDSDACWSQFEPIADCRDVYRCFASETLNGCSIKGGRIAPSLRWCEAEASERLWNQVILFPSAHYDRKILVLRDRQINSDVTRSHVI